MDRRGFLNLGRTVISNSSWDQFQTRLRRFVHGTWQSLSDSPEGYSQARLTLNRAEDIRHVLELARVYEVALVLEGINQPGDIIGRSALWLHLSTDLTQNEPIGEDACLAGPATRVGALQDQGYHQFDQVPPDLTLALWFAQSDWHDKRPGYAYLSGVERIHANFANGEQAILGSFGTQDKMPLSNKILHQTIPSLFELLLTKQAEDAFTKNTWPFVYRFDSLKAFITDSNLARVFLGHGGTLLWVQSFVIRKIPSSPLSLTNLPLDDSADYIEIEQINRQIKEMFDPNGLFPYWDEVKYSESLKSK